VPLNLWKKLWPWADDLFEAVKLRNLGKKPAQLPPGTPEDAPERKETVSLGSVFRKLYVFMQGTNLPSLSQMEEYIKKHGLDNFSMTDLAAEHFLEVLMWLRCGTLGAAELSLFFVS